MSSSVKIAGLLVALCVAAANADIVVVNYSVDAGGSNNNALNGLSARATFTTSGNQLTILLENTSTGVPSGFGASDSLLSSLAFNSPVSISNGVSSVIGAGSRGLGQWSTRTAGASVAEEWLWGNQGAGDLLDDYSQVITTSNGLGGASAFHFAGASGNVGGPYGGIAGAPPRVSIPGSQRAVSNSLFFTLTMAAPLSATQLALLTQNSIVEYGSDKQYLTAVPAPGAIALGVIGLAMLKRLRREA